MKSVYDYSIKDLEDYFISIGEKKFKAMQLFDWLYVKRVDSFDNITNIKKEILDKVRREFIIDKLVIASIQKDDKVNKYLFKLSDGQFVESVLMHHDYGISLCISSQVGCNIGCKFCLSGTLKKVRNLTPGEMLLQIMMVEEDIKTRISHIVIMGIGEPFDNYDNFTKFIEIINHPKGINIGSRHITVSTSGIVPRIREFSSFPFQVNLAISLHSADDKTRSELMPINKVYPIKDLIESVKYYIEKTNRRVTLEYIMIRDVNDSDEDALKLCELLKGINCYVNLIMYNETDKQEYKRSKKNRILTFYDIIKKNKLNVTIRKELGSSISAACGQLRGQKEDV